MESYAGVITINPCLSKCLEFFRCVEIFRCIWFNSRYVGLNQPPILGSIVYLDTSANIRELGAWRIHLIQCTWHFLNHNKELPLRILIWTADISSGLIWGTPQDYILLHRVLHFPGTPQIAFSLTECFFVALFSCYSTKLHTIFTLVYFSLHSPTSLDYHQYGTYGQPGEESLFTEESSSPPWESTCTCTEEDSQYSLQI